MIENEQITRIQFYRLQHKSVVKHVYSKNSLYHRLILASKINNNYNNNNNNNNNNNCITAFPTYRRLFICNNKLATLSTLRKKTRIFTYNY